jgi:hypothetical protein
MFSRKALVVPVAAIAFVLGLTVAAGAQEYRGSITGSVADQSGGVLPGVTVEEYEGSDSYHGGTIQLQKRFANANSISAQYTYSRSRDKLNYLNPADGILEDRVAPQDRPHRFSIGTVMRLPFGRNEKWGDGWNGVVDAFLGGWQLSSTYQYQSGSPLTWGNVYYDSACGDPKDLESYIGRNVSGGTAGLTGDAPAWNLSCFYFHDAAVQTNGVDDPAKQRADQRISMGNTLRYFPSTLPQVRTHQLHLLDFGLTKNFALPRGMRLQVRMEAINGLNTRSCGTRT